MNGLEARELRCFVAVAEELHFGRAAERLHVAQPAVSRTIGALERRLGVTLLDRTTRRVALTDAGAVLLEQGRAALAALDAAERLTVRAAHAEPALAVAVKPDGDAGLLPDVLAAYEREPEARAVELRLLGAAEMTAALHDGRADLAIVAAPFDASALECEEISREPRLAVLPTDHRLAAGPHLAVEDFAGEPVARWADVAPDLDAFYRALDPDSRPVRAAHGEGPLVRDLADALRLVELGRAITFLPRSVAERFADRSVAYRPVAGLSDSRLFVAWRARTRSPAVAAFVRAAVETAAAATPRSAA